MSNWIMQTALFITDCSIDSALALRNRLASPNQPPIRLTVVYPYNIADDEPLNKVTTKAAREAALSRLRNWKAIVGDTQANCLTTEILFADAALTLRIHLLIRHYDAVFTEDLSQPVSPILADLLAQTGTELHSLTGNVPEPAAVIA
jgi:hypothetical protein